MTERERLTTERRKIFARESLTLMSMNKEELRRHYNEIFDRLQEYEVAEENNQIIVPPKQNDVQAANDKQAKLLIDEMNAKFDEQNKKLKNIEDKINALIVRKGGI